MRYKRTHVVLALGISCALTGCSSRPPTLKPPEFDAQKASLRAIQTFDADGDGQLNERELKKAPALEFALDRIDQNADKTLTVDEIEKHIGDTWIEEGAGVIRVRCQVTLDGKDLDDAEVTFEPAPFLGEGVIHGARGRTRRGVASLSVAPEHMVHSNARGVTPGLYLVRISKREGDKELIPSKYNTETTLGVEVARRASYMPGMIEFDLRSR